MMPLDIEIQTVWLIGHIKKDTMMMVGVVVVRIMTVMVLTLYIVIARIDFLNRFRRGKLECL